MKKNTAIQASKFLISVMQGDIDQISSCLLKGANIHENAGGYNCLHYAIAKNNPNTTDVIKTLLEAKANINEIDKKGRTPLIHAVKKNNLPATQTLLDQGADVSIQDLQGNDALRHAVISKTSVDIIRLLINKGANVNLPDSERITPLILAAKCDNAEAAKLLIDRGADILAEDHDCQTALRYAAINNHLSTLKVLLHAGAFDTNNLSNHAILFQLTSNIGAYFGQCISGNREGLAKDFDKIVTLSEIANYLVAYGSDIKISQDILTYLANYHPSTAYYLFIKNPVMTLTAISNVLYIFLDHVQKIDHIEKSHVDITLAIFRIFTLLKPTCIPKALVDLKENIITSAADRDEDVQIRLAVKQTPCNLTRNEEGKITYKLGVSFDLGILIPSLKEELSKAQKTKDIFYNISEIDQLKISLDKLNKTEIYKDAFSDLLSNLEKTRQEGKEVLMQRQMQYLLSSPIAKVMAMFKVTEKIDLDKIKDLKSFFAHDKEVKILESQTEHSSNAVQFTITLSLPHEEFHHFHYNQICKRVLDQLQSLCKADEIVAKEIYFPQSSNKYQFPVDILNKMFSLLSTQEYFEIAVMGKQIFPELCSKIIAQYNELKQISHEQQAPLEEQIRDTQISGDILDEQDI